MTPFEKQSTVTGSTPKDANDGRTAFVLFVGAVLASLASLVIFVFGVQKSEARFYDGMRVQGEQGYAAVVEAKKLLAKKCPEFVSIGDSSGLAGINPEIVQAHTGKTFANLNLNGSVGFSGYLTQVQYLQDQGCNPQKIIIYLTPRFITNDFGKLGGTFESFFTPLQFGGITDGMISLVTNIESFPLIFRFSGKTYLRYLLSLALEEGEHSIVQAATKKMVGVFNLKDSGSAEKFDSKMHNKKTIQKRIQGVVDAGGFIPLPTNRQDMNCESWPGEYKTKYLNNFKQFRNSLHRYYPKETYLVVSVALPDCRKDFSELLSLLGDIYDVAPVRVDSNLFYDRYHPNTEGVAIISKKLAKIILP